MVRQLRGINKIEMLVNQFYYVGKPFIPRWLQISLRRKIVKRKRSIYTSVWPIDERASGLPEQWSGWPEQRQFAFVLTHDVDTAEGREKCLELMRLEEELGFVSSFNFVPERYEVSSEFRHCLTSNGFEVGIHGLCHDGKLYKSREIFQARAVRINHYLRAWKAVGFRSPAMHHNLEWIHDLAIDYDASTFDTDPFEPQPDGVRTIFPFWVKGNYAGKGYLELPYTLPQDFTLFVLMKEKDIEIWKRKLDWIVTCGGMALLNTHPDYMNFDDNKGRMDEYPVGHYVEFLEYIKRKYEGIYWHILPREIACFWSKAGY